MKKHVPLKATVCFSVYNGSFLLKERPVGFKGKMYIYGALIINHLQIRKIQIPTNFPQQRLIQQIRTSSPIYFLKDRC